MVAWNSKPKGGADKIASYLTNYAEGYTAKYGAPYTVNSSYKFDIIHNHTFIRRVVDYALKKGKPLVSTVHSPPFSLKYYPDQGYALRNSIKVVVINKWLRKFVIDVYGIDDDKVVVINNGSPMDIIPSIDVKPRDYYVVGYHGRITEDKGVDKLIEAIKFLREECGFNVVLRLLGWPNMKIPRLKYTIHDRPTLDDRKVAHWIDNIDLEVIPTKNDQQPLTAIEALLRGRHVIISKLETLEEFDGLVEWIEPDIEPKKLGLEIYRALKTFKSYDEKLQREASKRFGLWRFIRDYKELYDGL